MDKPQGIVQVEAVAVCVGLILLALVIATIVVFAIVVWMRHKMKERSEFTIHISRNFNNSMREKETPISDLDRHSLKNDTFDGLESSIGMVNTQESPFHEQTSSFIPKPKETLSGFTNPHIESELSLPKMAETGEETYLGSGNGLQTEDIQVVYDEPAEITKPFVAPLQSSNQTTPTPKQRPPPMLPVIKPKPYESPDTATDKPAIPEKPAVSPRPPRVKPPALAPKPVVENYYANQGVEMKAKPDIKPKPKPSPRKV